LAFTLIAFYIQFLGKIIIFKYTASRRKKTGHWMLRFVTTFTIFNRFTKFVHQIIPAETWYVEKWRRSSHAQCVAIQYRMTAERILIT